MVCHCVADWRWTGKTIVSEESTGCLREEAAQEKKKHLQRSKSVDLARIGQAEEDQEA